MNILKIQDTVTFELYDCIGIVLQVLDGKDFNYQEHPILTFDSLFKIIDSRIRFEPPPNKWYRDNCVMYQILIGNHKAWLGNEELERAIEGENLS